MVEMSNLMALSSNQQAYVCRDCGSVVHKRCHASVTEECPNASVTVPEEDEEEGSETNTET